jgi:hypothetical protein
MLNEILNKRNSSKSSKLRSHCSVTMAQRDEYRDALAPQSDREALALPPDQDSINLSVSGLNHAFVNFNVMPYTNCLYISLRSAHSAADLRGTLCAAGLGGVLSAARSRGALSATRLGGALSAAGSTGALSAAGSRGVLSTAGSSGALSAAGSGCILRFAHLISCWQTR